MSALFFFVFEKEDGRKEIVTPPLSRGDILPGVTRRSIVELANKWEDFDMVERNVGIEEVANAVKAAVGGSWVEFYYPPQEGGSGQPIGSNAYTLNTGSGITQTLPNAVNQLTPGDFFVHGPIDLLNNYDSISLVDGNGDIRQVVEWQSPHIQNVS